MRGESASLFTPATVSDPSDGQIAHLHGLNASQGLPGGGSRSRSPPATRGSSPPRRAARPTPMPPLRVVGDDCMVEHWLACYAGPPAQLSGAAAADARRLPSSPCPLIRPAQWAGNARYTEKMLTLSGYHADDRADHLVGLGRRILASRGTCATRAAKGHDLPRCLGQLGGPADLEWYGLAVSNTETLMRGSQARLRPRLTAKPAVVKRHRVALAQDHTTDVWGRRPGFTVATVAKFPAVEQIARSSGLVERSSH